MLFFGFNKLVIASGNPGKLAEFDALLAPLGIQVISQTSLGITDPEETGTAFVENALIKARNAAKLSGFAALADDSGLCVDVLDGAPGLNSAHYAGEHGNTAANIAKLLSEMRGAHNRSARFISVLVLVRHELDPLPLIAQGEWRGEILLAPRGSNGFGRVSKATATLTVLARSPLTTCDATRVTCPLYGASSMVTRTS